MGIPLPARLWARLSFVARLGVSAGTALLFAAALMLYSSIKSDTVWHQARLAAQASNALRYMVPALDELVVLGDYATLEQMLAAQAKHDDITQLRFVSSKGTLVQADTLTLPQTIAPRWFASFTGLLGEDASIDMIVGGTLYGTLNIKTTPISAINRTWENFRNHLLILVLVLGLDFIGILLIIKNGLRPLDALNKGARQLGTGEFAARIPIQGSPEMQSVIGSFNVMADNIQSLITDVYREKELALVTLRSIGDAVITTDNHELVVYLNPVAEQLTGWTTEEARGLPLMQVFNIINEYSREKVENPVDKVLREGVIVGLANHTALISRNGNEYAIEDSAAPIRDRDGNIHGVVLVFHDVSDKRKLAHQLSYQARHDALTGLINRSEFEHQLVKLLDSATNEKRQHALLYLDLDQFKVINDTCGHSAGDELLRQLTAHMHHKIRTNDIFARLGGDEFAVLLENCPLDQALRLANGLLDEVRTFRFNWLEKTFTIGVSIGLVEINETSGNSAAVLSVADTACYAAKDNGRNRVQVYSPDDKEMAQRHGEMNWVAHITKAFEENRFRLFYQSIVPVQENAQAQGPHFEILLRMLDEKQQLVPPGAFIPAAERYNMMVDIDRWVVKSTFNWLLAHAGQPVTCAINLSGQSVNDDRFLAFLVDQIKKSGVQPQKVCFEITETAAISNLTKASSFIKTIKLLGCSFSLDDFGSGMSSFSYLKNLPVDYLKIDGSFVSDMIDDPIDCAMVESINNIGHVLGIKTIAEFVENEAILAKLQSIGVDYAQGYGIAKPRPLDDME
ncbi:MAG: EAL domain-containing protein [Sulfurimicrobium sp.]|nr:EAL domain-containing protein [Sulfurimicrobium sp.]